MSFSLSLSPFPACAGFSLLSEWDAERIAESPFGVRNSLKEVQSLASDGRCQGLARFVPQTHLRNFVCFFLFPFPLSRRRFPKRGRSSRLTAAWRNAGGSIRKCVCREATIDTTNHRNSPVLRGMGGSRVGEGRGKYRAGEAIYHCPIYGLVAVCVARARDRRTDTRQMDGCEGRGAMAARLLEWWSRETAETCERMGGWVLDGSILRFAAANGG